MSTANFAAMAREPFTRYRAAGYQVQVLHQIGRAALARLDKPGEAPSYAATFRRAAYAGATWREAVAGARAQLRARLVQEQQLIGSDEASTLGMSGAMWVSFCAFNDLDHTQRYPLATLRRAVAAQRDGNCQRFGEPLRIAASRLPPPPS